MPKTSDPTRERILDAANRLFYAEGIRAVSVDAIAETAQLTKRTLYYHFKSKDDLIAAYLEARDQPNLVLFAKWFNEANGTIADRVEAIFIQLAKAARHRKWKGCGFLRTAAELANMPGHPAIKIGSAHKKKFEAWLAGILDIAGSNEPSLLARQIVLLMDGAFSVMLVHRDASYVEAAGAAAKALVNARCTSTNNDSAQASGSMARSISSGSR
ncbi:TetR/AcrR family transcriptional regulator [Phyllobacterium sp. TAF24]|uniref:TetR/AcrR family transcriptional regulator n=1 Tax=Phyllobacterium sp. TAF24 TaxID=3233068 RepID=UPI003F954186